MCWLTVYEEDDCLGLVTVFGLSDICLDAIDPFLPALRLAVVDFA